MTTPRPGGSRPGVGRPRKVAGRRPESAEAGPVVEEGAPAPVSKPPEPRSEADPVAGDGGFESGLRPSSTTGRPARRRTTWVLAAVIAVLGLVGIGEVVYLAHDPEPTISAARPVVTGELSHRAAVEAAARATEQILSTSYQDYDAQVDEATSKMTDSFAVDYRKLADSLKAKYAQQQMKLTVKAVAQGVVQASSKQVQALLFLNQYVEKVQDGKPATAYAQYRALVTVVHTDRGWLVSGIDTK